MTVTLPVIDVAPLRTPGADRRSVAVAIDAACRDTGFFFVVGHGVDAELRNDLERLARAFFALDETEKARIAMEHGGRAWRGWFPVGGELTSGVPDIKEGIYFGRDLPAGDPRPLHGPNLYPPRPEGFADAVGAYMAALTALGHVVARGVALGLGLDQDWFADHMTADPTVLFRIFHYPAGPDLIETDDQERWGVAEHTDYGLLTLLAQDDIGGLEIRTSRGWIAAPPVPDAFVCNLGDMLERMTGGRYRSTPHRVRNTGDTGRVSFAFFFDPSWDAEVQPVPGFHATEVAPRRWDGEDPFAFRGTYGDYLTTKVAKVFPALGKSVL